MSNSLVQCTCQTAAAPAAQFTSLSVGTDATHGRFGEVTIEQCQQCQRVWLKYFVEYEGTSQSGRWLRAEYKPTMAAELLQQLGVTVWGGSFFQQHTAPADWTLPGTVGRIIDAQ